MAATPKAIRRLSKAVGESNRKSPPKVLKGALKNIIKKDSKESEKMISRTSKSDTRKSLQGLGKKQVIRKEMNKK